MKIAVIAPSVFMSEKTYPTRIYAPRTVTLQLVEGLVTRGHDVTLFSSPDIQTKAKLIGGSAELLKADLPRDKFMDRERLTEYVVQSAVEVRSFYSIELINKALVASNKEKFDIIQTQADEMFLFPFREQFLSPVVFTLHDNLPRPESFDYWFYNKYKNYNYISISNSQIRGEPQLNVVGNVYHGLDSKKYTPSFEKGSYLAYFGRLLIKKGPDIALRIAKELNEPLKIASDKTHFNTDFVKENILPFIDGKTIEQVAYKVSAQEKSDFLNQAKALLLPLSWEEPFGLVMIEAMACGTPVIAYNRGSVSEIVKDGVTGFIIDPDDEERPGRGSFVIKQKGVEGLKEAVKRISEIDRRKCQEHVETHFSVEKMIDGYETIYKQLLNTS
jgi:glycosyltransferase involved in cell wall biosynthesis